MHTITTRAPTADESRVINRLAGFDFANYGCLMIFGILPVYVFGMIGGWVGSFNSPEAVQTGRFIGWVVAVIAFISALTIAIPIERRRRRRAQRDLDSQQVQEIHVVNPRVVQLCALTDNEPILAFDIGSDQILYLQGQWLCDPASFGAEYVEDDDALDDFVNRLPPPHAFPSSEFTVTRLPRCGEVFGIRVSGEYIDPGPEIAAMELHYEFSESELFTGSLENIADILNREHSKRIRDDQ
jgi:hypothetical protein